MTLSETPSDKFCQSPFFSIFIFQGLSEAETFIFGTLAPALLAASGIFTAETPRTPRKIEEKPAAPKRLIGDQNWRLPLDEPLVRRVVLRASGQSSTIPSPTADAPLWRLR